MTSDSTPRIGRLRPHLSNIHRRNAHEHRDRDPGRRLLLGHAGPDPPPARRHLDARRLLAAATCRTPPIATTARMPRRSRSCSIPTRSATATSSSSSSRSTIRPRRTGRATMSARSYRSAIFYRDDEQKQRRRGHHRRRRCLGPVARQGGHRSRAGRSVLGSRARASGLPGALSDRLHLPLRPPGLEAAEARVTQRAFAQRPLDTFVCIPTCNRACASTLL